MSDPAFPAKISSHAEDLPALVAMLVRWNEGRDLGRLSALRAWWRPSAHYVAVPVMGSLLGQRLGHPVWSAIPALFALHRLHTDREHFNLGGTCRVLAGDARDTFAAHFRRLLACNEGDDLEDLTGVLRRLVQRAAAEGVPINYFLLGLDLFRWRKSPVDARQVKTNWAKEYYRAHNADEPDAPGAVDLPIAL